MNREAFANLLYQPEWQSEVRQYMSDSRKKIRNLILFKAPSIKTVYYISRHRRRWGHLRSILRFINVCAQQYSVTYIPSHRRGHHFLVFIHFARRSSCLQMFQLIGHLFSVQFKITGKLVLLGFRPAALLILYVVYNSARDMHWPLCSERSM